MSHWTGPGSVVAMWAAMEVADRMGWEAPGPDGPELGVWRVDGRWVAGRSLAHAQLRITIRIRGLGSTLRYTDPDATPCYLPEVVGEPHP